MPRARGVNESTRVDGVGGTSRGTARGPRGVGNARPRGNGVPTPKTAAQAEQADKGRWGGSPRCHLSAPCAQALLTATFQQARVPLLEVPLKMRLYEVTG